MEVFTTGYPRSGSTWLNRILSDMLDAKQQDIPGAVEVIEFATKIRPEHIVRKTHWYRYQYSGKGYNDQPSKIVWISRDPRDMCVSIMNYRGLTPDKLTSTIASLDNPGSGDHVGIHAFVRGWTDDPPDFHITYEELHKGDVLQFEHMYEAVTGRFLGTKRINEVIERQKFAKWSGQFPHSMRKGIVGDWRNYFSRDDAQLFEELYGDLLRDLGYESDSNWWQKL